MIRVFSNRHVQWPLKFLLLFIEFGTQLHRSLFAPVFIPDVALVPPPPLPHSIALPEIYEIYSGGEDQVFPCS